MKRKINKIIVHCTATPEGRYVSVDDIRRWHLDRGWSDIGYHYVIDLYGMIHEGRPLYRSGAHTKGHNSDSIGITYVGGMSSDMSCSMDTRTDEQKETLDFFLKYLKNIHPNAEIFGHRDFSNKDCPSFDARSEYKSISEMYSE